MRKILAIVVVLSLWAAPASAQDKAGAEAAFRDGRKLMDQGKHAEACEKFKLSNELDPALGTLLNLADCHDKIGKTASAWGEFTEVADKAGRAGDSAREKVARRRAKALEPQLVRLVIKPSGELPPGAVVKRNGTDVSPTVGTALPVDPGSYQVEVSADGYETWTKQVEVAGEGQTVSVEIPALKKSATTGGGAVGNGASGGADLSGSTEVDTSRRRNRQIIAAATGGVGVVSLSVGLLFGNSARSKNNDSDALCDDDNICTDEGFELRTDAQSAATKSNIFVGIGIAAVAAGVVLWVTAPDAESSAGTAIAPSVGPDSVGLSLSGRF